MNKEKFDEIISSLDYSVYVEFYDFKKNFIKKYSGWHKLDNDEKREIFKQLYKTYY